MQKPTPAKIVLLMSAAGLGLSWSGIALAARGIPAPSNVALSFGVPTRDDKTCDLGTSDDRASCPIPEGELLQKIAADAASLPLPLPLPLPPTYSANGATLLLRLDTVAAAAQRSHEARTGDGEPASNEEAPRHALTPSGQIDDGANGEADALAWVVMDDPQRRLGASRSGAEPSDGISRSPAERPDQTRAARRVVKADRVAIAVPAASNPPHSTHEIKAPPASDGDTNGASAAAVSDAGTSDAASVERVWASLVDVLGSQLEDSPAAVQAAHEQVVASPRAAAIVVATEPSPHVSTTPAGDVGSPLARSEQADDIVVSSHAEKVLSSLAVLRSADIPDTTDGTPERAKKVVVRHSDKVLETLALFQSRKPGHGHACMAAPESEPLSSNAWVPFELATESAIANLGLDLDIDLNLLALPAAKPDRSSAAPNRPVAVEAPVAGRDQPSALGGDVVALNSDKLDEVRGGFVTDGGLKISFGIERAVYLNGTLVTTTSLNIADLSKISGGQAQVTSNGAGSLALIQSGSGNLFAPGSVSANAAGTIIQNTLDNQKINTITRIDAVVNSTSILRSMNLQSSMQSAIVNSLRR
ncbi:MAG TPA: hypothetical protein PLE54_18605 [Burkholderiaceae bacterium]|nr:hypothetical protein [Burkholderiaceae bacterium]